MYWFWQDAGIQSHCSAFHFGLFLGPWLLSGGRSTGPHQVGNGLFLHHHQCSTGRLHLPGLLPSQSQGKPICPPHIPLPLHFSCSTATFCLLDFSIAWVVVVYMYVCLGGGGVREVGLFLPHLKFYPRDHLSRISVSCFQSFEPALK